MEAVMAYSRQGLDPHLSMARSPRVVSAAEFRELLVSHRRLIREDRRAEKLRGLKDLDTGELFVTDEQRLFEPLRRALSA